MKLAMRSLLVLVTSLALAGWPQALTTTSAEPSMAAAAAAAPTAERVIDRAITDVALALDADGHRHVAATTAQGGLWYATDRTGAWQAERILVGASGWGWTVPSIATDELGRVHIAAARMTLGQTPNSALGIWYVTDAGRPRGDFGPATRIARAGMTSPSLKVADGVRYLAFAECRCPGFETDTGLFFKTDRSGDWKTERVATGAADPALRVASDGRAHVVFRYRNGIGYARARTASGDFTEARRLPGTAGKRGVPSLALDGADRPRVAWADGERVWYVERTASAWRSPRQVGKGHATEISLDALGRPHVAFARNAFDGNGPTPRGAVHRWRVAGAWKQQVLNRGARVNDVDIRAFGGGASVAWSQSEPLRGLWISPAS